MSLVERLWESDEASVLTIEAALEIERLRKIILDTREIVKDGAMTGFNCHDGDWAERLFVNNGNLSRGLTDV